MCSHCRLKRNCTQRQCNKEFSSVHRTLLKDLGCRMRAAMNWNETLSVSVSVVMCGEPPGYVEVLNPIEPSSLFLP
jgi:hypothetical protein